MVLAKKAASGVGAYDRLRSGARDMSNDFDGESFAWLGSLPEPLLLIVTFEVPYVMFPEPTSNARPMMPQCIIHPLQRNNDKGVIPHVYPQQGIEFCHSKGNSCESENDHLSL
jgi:hypothetical protein